MPNVPLDEPAAVARQSAHINGLDLFYLDTNTREICDGIGERTRAEQPNQPLMLCLHGRFGRGETWLDLMGRYADRFRIVAPDQRGHGFSAKPRGKYTSEELAQDAAALLAHLDSGPALVIGHSMGGRIAGYLAALYPHLVSALVILDQTATGPEVASSLSLDSLPPADAFTADWPLPFSSQAQARHFLLRRTQSEVRTQYYLDSLIEREDGYHMLFSQQAMAAIFEYQADWFHLLPDILQPVLVVRAKASKELPPGRS
ncbi:MAG: alpha/beta hydrolase [Pseudomonadota bacterium]